MEKKLASDEVVVEILGAEEKSNNIEVDEEEVQGLRSRKKGPSLLSTEISKSRFDEEEISADDWNDEVTASSPPLAYHDYDDDIQPIKELTTTREKITLMFVIESSLFVCITLVLILSLTMSKLKDKEIWSLELWKWCGLGLAIFCGRLLSAWSMNIPIFLIEYNLLLRKNIFYYIYASQKSFRVFIWLGLILVAWVLLIIRSVNNRSNDDIKKVVNYITRGIASTLVIAGAWLLRTIVEKFLYASFYEKRFFERIQENIFNQYILKTLSGPPASELIDRPSLLTKYGTLKSSTAIDVKKLQRMKPGNVSAWTMSMLIELASQSGFYTYSNTNDEQKFMEWNGGNRRIVTDYEAKAAAYLIFRNVAKPGYKYIERDDLLRYMIREEVGLVFALIGGATGSERINQKSVFNWVVSMSMKSKVLEHSLYDIKESIKQLNKFVTGILVVMLMILWVILMGILKTEVLLFISSQFLLAVFTFGSSAKSTIEAMIFVFLKHPFDAGDRVVIDGVQVLVEEVNILTTICLRNDNEKIYYPNSELATKSISNFNRSPDMRDTVEFDLDVSTSANNISALKAKIKTYIESKPDLWGPEHRIRVREIEDMKKMKIRLYVTHTINFQDYGEKCDRRSNLVLELKNIFQDLGIKYHILPPTSYD